MDILGSCKVFCNRSSKALLLLMKIKFTTTTKMQPEVYWEWRENEARRGGISKGWGIEEALSLQGAAGPCSQVQGHCDFQMVARYGSFSLRRVGGGTCESLTHKLPAKFTPKSGDDMVVEGRFGKLLLAEIIGYFRVTHPSGT